MSFNNDGHEPPARHSQPVSSTSSRVRLNNPPTLISLTASRSQVDSIRSHHGSSTGGVNRGSSSSSLLKDYTKDQHIASKPPLPNSVQGNRPQSSRMLSQRNSGLAWATTPRMRVPIAEFPPPFISNGRPVSPLSRGFRGPPLDAMMSFQNQRMHSNDNNSHSATNFQYNGPHQIYGGPISNEGPQPLQWPFISSNHQIQPPPPPPGILKDMTKQSSVVNLTPRRTSSGHLSRTETEQDFLINVLQAARQPDSPFESHRGSMLLTSPPAGDSRTTSFPSSQALREMEQASMGNITANPTLNSIGPFDDSGIPNEIQDDLLRIEMLLEFRKYKEALNQKIQNQNQILQLVNSRGQLNSQQQQQQPQQQQSPPNNLRLGPSQPSPQLHQWHTLSTVMDSPPQYGGSGGASPGGGNSVAPDLTEEKPVWPDEIAEQFTSPNFLLNTFIEPHILPSSLGINQAHHNLNHQNPQSQQQQQQQNSRQHSTSRGDDNANDTKSISMLQTRNFDEFQALAEQSRSGFPMGMVQQNPLLVGALQYNSSPPYPFTPVPVNQRTPAEVTRATPLRIQVAPKEPAQQKSSPSPQQQQQNQQGPSSTMQQQYQKYLLDRSFQSLSPNSFKVLEQAVNRDMMMMRKPVAVSFSPKSPIHNKSPDEAATPNDSITANVGTEGGRIRGQMMDRPSPFFPGFSGSPEMKIKTPEEVLANNSNGGANNSVNKALNHLEGVEELGNLLSQLPVLTRKQKVEEFQLVNTLKPVSPVTDAESETSMIPLVSSNGTLVSERRPDSEDTAKLKIEAEDEFKNVDTNKLSINELVTLGRKIYRILSQLSNNSNTNIAASPTQQVVTTPMTLNIPSPNTPVFTTSGSKQGLSTPGLTSPQVVVDFNRIPNPSFVTGPGLSKSTPKLANTGRTRTPTQQPPNLFRKVLQPPPTRWGGDGGSSKQRATAMSNPPPSASSRKYGMVSPRDSQTQQQPMKKRQPRAQYRRSMSSIMSATVSGSVQALGKSETRAVLKLVPPSPVAAQRTSTPVRLVNTNPETLPESFTVREKYSNNHSGKNMSKFKQRRQSTPYPYQPGGLLYDGTTKPEARSSVNTPATSHTRGRSVGRRNFIQENISKVRNMKKLPDSRLRPRQLPPISKKKYENIPSTIPGSRSRSRSREESQNDLRYNRRSSSVPVSTVTGGYSPYRQYPMRSVSTPRPSTGMSVHVTSSRSRSSSQIRPASRTRPASQGTLTRPNLVPAPKIPKPKASQVSAKSTGSKVRFSRLPSKSSMGNGDSFGGSNSTLGNVRKSRSKTKRISLVQKKASRHSSLSSTEQQQPVKVKKLANNTNKGKNTKPPKARKAKKTVMFGETLSTDDEVTESPLFNSASEQRMIREMVKAEMNMMVQQHVKNALKKEQKDNSRSRSREPRIEEEPPEDQSLRRQQDKHDFDEEVDEGGDTEGMDATDNAPPPEEDQHDPQKQHDEKMFTDMHENDEIESENLTPVYTPPRYYDESLFSLEKWINPEVNSLPGSAYTSAKETPLTTANSYGMATGGVRKQRVTSKPQTVRFSLPSHPKNPTSK